MEEEERPEAALQVSMPVAQPYRQWSPVSLSGPSVAAPVLGRTPLKAGASSKQMQAQLLEAMSIEAPPQKQCSHRLLVSAPGT
jgi:hypothetical protein